MSIFTQPYPKESTPQRKIIFSLLFGVFIFLFLMVFQPFGLHQWEVSNKTARLLGYGAITTLVLLFNAFVLELVFKNWFREENWKVWKEIIWAIWCILIIGTFNLLYSNWMGLFSLTISNFINFQVITLVIGIFPVTVVTLMNYTRLQKKNLENARKINQIIETDPQIHPKEATGKMLSFRSENGKEQLTFFPDDILLIASADNYVEIYHQKDGTLKKELLRNTLKNLEPIVVDYPYLVRCHRSYLVNIQKVEKVSGNSQGYKLHMSMIHFAVPVSRNLNEFIREKIENHHSIHPS